MQTPPSDNAAAPSVSGGKDQYCYICEDGGRVIECNLCHRSFCYGVIGEAPEDEDQAPCIVVPSRIANEEHHIFPCPECLYVSQAQAAPYVINRGPRVTMRRAPRTSVVLVVFSIASLMPLALSIHGQILAALGAFEMNVAAVCSLLHLGLTEGDEDSLIEQLGEETAFHLVCVFLTESNPGGGWWSKSGQHAAQSPEGEFLKFLGNQVRHLSRNALTVRYFGSSCGWNLPGQGVVEDIKATLEPANAHSIVLPTTGSLLQCDYAHILPELFLNLYYFGTPLEAALYKVWGQSDEVRKHTGLLILSRRTKSEILQVEMVTYSPFETRPLGVQLPIPSTVCGCPCQGDDTWDFLKDEVRGFESIFVYVSRCCGTMLQTAVFHGRRRTVSLNEALFSVERWNAEARAFDFKESTMVRMKLFPKPADRRNVGVEQGAWTIAGRAAMAQKVVKKAARIAAREAAAAS